MSDINEFGGEVEALLKKYKDQPVSMLVGALEGVKFYLLSGGGV